MSSPLVYRMSELIGVVGLSKTTIYHMVKKGEFPAPIQLTKKSVAWRAVDVRAWVASRPDIALPDGSGAIN